MKITPENLVEQAEVLRSENNGETLQNYLYEQMNVTPDTFETYTDVDLSKPIETVEAGLQFAKACQKVWSALPDRASIREYPFFKICDLAEFWCEEGCVMLAVSGSEPF